MKIQILKTRSGEYRADCLDLPGTPPVGIGRNKYEAVGSLIFVLRLDKTWEKYGIDFELDEVHE